MMAHSACKKFPGFEPAGRHGASLRVLLVPVWVGLIGNSKLPVGLNVRVNGCLFLCVNPVIDWQPVQGVQHQLRNLNWNWLQSHPPPCDHCVEMSMTTMAPKQSCYV